jgi:parallel beta-helix repeat protein
MKKLTAIVVCLLGVAGLYWYAQAGDMEPPGPRAPTMKTLDEVRLGTPIHQADVPLTITQPGLYFLAEDLSVASGDVITIDADDVTLDLNGSRISASTGRSVLIADDVTRIVVANGHITGGGIACPASTVNPHITVADIRAANLATPGIELHDVGTAEILRCRVNTALEYGIAVLGGTDATCRIESNVVTDVTGGSSPWKAGIFVMDTRGCQIENNISTGSDAAALRLLESETARVVGNVCAYSYNGLALGDSNANGYNPSNLVQGNNASNNTNIGIVVVEGSVRNLIEGNVINDNAGWGIYFMISTDGCAYRNNMIRGNGVAVGETIPGASTDAGGNIY